MAFRVVCDSFKHSHLLAVLESNGFLFRPHEIGVFYIPSNQAMATPKTFWTRYAQAFRGMPAFSLLRSLTQMQIPSTPDSEDQHVTTYEGIG